jgi:integrative and conjugative element protein (TIGR02256 family)
MLTVSLPSDIVRKLEAALRSAGADECGGILMGEHIGPNSFVVRELTVQGVGSFARFVREAKTALLALKGFFARTRGQYTRFNYLGEWHSHPCFSVEPSVTDHRSMLDMVRNPSVGANFLVLMVVKLDVSMSVQGSIHLYLPDGTVSRGELNINAQEQ